MDNDNENINDMSSQPQEEIIDNLDDDFDSVELPQESEISYSNPTLNVNENASNEIPSKNNSYSLNQNNNTSDDGAYRAKNRKEELEKERSQESNKKTTKAATQAAATALAGPAGGKIASAINNTQIGNKIHDTFAKKMEEASHRNPRAKKLQDSLNKLNDVGALDAVQTGLDMANANAEGAAQSAAQNAATKSASGAQNAANAANNANSAKTSPTNQQKKFNTNFDINNKKSSINTSEDEKKKIIKQKLFSLIKKHPWILGVFATMFIIIIILLLMGGAAGADDAESSENASNSMLGGCSEFPMKSTSLSEDEFAELLKKNLSPTGNDNARIRQGKETFIANADTIYKIATDNSVNPELVVVRAIAEGFTPGMKNGIPTNNYWGMGVYNGQSDGIHYSSFDEGVLGFVQNVSQYATVTDMMSRYGYIGDYWANAGSNSLGGCQFVSNIQPYYDNQERASEVLDICNKNSCPWETVNGTAVISNTSNCERTNQEDQLAYAKFNAHNMVVIRQTIFELSAVDCTSYVDGAGTVIDISNITDERELGNVIVNRAINSFDHWKYSQDLRQNDGYVDCASLVDRAYRQVGIDYLAHEIKGKYGTTWSEEIWCQNNNVLFTNIDPSNLIPGDLLFTAHGAEGYPTHVALYAGNNKTFEATGVQSNREDDVRVIQYSNLRSYFVSACRPLAVYFKSKNNGS